MQTEIHARGGFANHSHTYAQNRPIYPPALFNYLASIAPSCATAWDSGTGNGQAAIGLADKFEFVIATDISREQIARSTSHPRVQYRQAPSENSGIDSSCIDLIVAAQSAHWYDLDAFYAETRRVAKPQAVIAVWTYYGMEVTPEIDPLVTAQVYEKLLPYREQVVRQHVVGGYRKLPFPFTELPVPGFFIERELDYQGFLGFVRSQSGFINYPEPLKEAFIENLNALIRPLWNCPKLVRTPIMMRVGIV